MFTIIQILTAQEEGMIVGPAWIAPKGDNFHHYPIIEQSIFVVYTSHIDFLFTDWLKLHYVSHSSLNRPNWEPKLK